MRKHLASLMIIFATLPAHAYQTVLDNAEIMPAGQFKLTGAAQALTESGGLNALAQVDGGISEDMGMRGLFGFGKTDVFFGGLVKWIPVPDIDDQPAVGFNAGLLYAKDNNRRDTTLRFEPLVSKKFQLDGNMVTPYASLPLGIRMRSSSDPDIQEGSVMTWQLVAGSQLQIERWKKLQFIGEVGIDLDNSSSHVAVGAILYFDEEGFAIE